MVIAKTAIVVPQQSAYVVEYLGKYRKTIKAGFHILIPFVERVAYKHNLKESAVDIQEQICITRDNVQVGVDGVLYLKVLDAQRASYGIGDYIFAIGQLAQTTLRSEIGKIDLDRTFEERGTINTSVVMELDKASDPWGVKVLRHEIKNINPPEDVLSAMEKQMRAEREKRAVILTSEGEREAKINEAEGGKQQVIKESEAAKQKKINEAEGEGRGYSQRVHCDRGGHPQGGARAGDRWGGQGHAAENRRAIHRGIRSAREGWQHVRGSLEPVGHRIDDRPRDGDREEGRCVDGMVTLRR